jgi:hypothetical protein
VDFLQAVVVAQTTVLVVLEAEGLACIRLQVLEQPTQVVVAVEHVEQLHHKLLGQVLVVLASLL